MPQQTNPKLAKAACPWCNVVASEAAVRHEGPHATWCVHFRESQRGGQEEAAEPRADGFVEYFVRQSKWSAQTFGHGTRTQGIVEHIRKELDEVLGKWIDLTMLAMDGFWRHGGDPRTILDHLNAKQAKNFARKWNVPKDGHAVEHVRDEPPPDDVCPVSPQELREIADGVGLARTGYDPQRVLPRGSQHKLRDLAAWLERGRV
jgi:hypothetical protein